MRTKNEFYFSLDKRDLPKVNGDIALWVWYSKLKDYTQRFKADKYGFVRISPRIYEEDIGISKRQVQRYNKKLEDKGLIRIDKERRGGRTWAGFKLI